MVKRAVGVVAASGVVVVCLLLPFAPGGHDGLAVGLSAMMQVLAYAAIILVPVGLGWIVFQRRGFGIASVVAGTLVAFFMAVATFETVGLSLGLIVLAGGGCVSLWMLRRLKTVRAVPLYMIVVPLVA